MPPNDNPITDTGVLTDPTRVTGTRVADASNVVKPAPAKEQKDKAKPKQDSLFLYDAGLPDAKGLHAAYYKTFKAESIEDWDDLVKVLARYSSIKTLVIFTHSVPGQLLLGHQVLATEDSKNRLVKTGVSITGSLIFEGCSIMSDPVKTSRVVSGIMAKGAVLRGHTQFSVFDTATFTAPKGVSASKMEEALAPYKRYLLPGQATGSAMAQKAKDKERTFVLTRRWFRKDLDVTPAPPLPVGTLPPREFIPIDAEESLTIRTADEARAAKAKFDAPVSSATLVTVTDVAAVAAAGEM